jgi:hypothetical protein
MRTRFSPALGLVLAALVATPATAQIGGLIKKAKKSAEAAVTPVPRAAAPEFNDDVLEITEARYQQLVTGIQAELDEVKVFQRAEADRKKNKAARDSADAEAEKRYQAALKKHEAELEIWDAKQVEQEKLVAEFDRKSEAYQKCQDDIEAANDKDAELAEKLLEENKVMEANAAAQRIKQRIDSCGPIPREPRLAKMPAAPTAPTRGRDNDLPLIDRVRKKGQEASGLKDRQYWVMRERWIDFCGTDGKPSMGFTDEEWAILTFYQKSCRAQVKTLTQANIL